MRVQQWRMGHLVALHLNNVRPGVLLDDGSEKKAKKPTQEVTFSPFAQSRTLRPFHPAAAFWISYPPLPNSVNISMFPTLAPQIPAALQCLVLISKYLPSVEKDKVGKREGKQKCSSIHARLRGRIK